MPAAAGVAADRPRSAGAELAVSPDSQACPTAASSLDQAYRSEKSRLLRYFGRRAGPEIAPDLVQEVFVRAAGSGAAERLRNPAAFLGRIARNLLIDRHRRGATGTVTVCLDERRDLAIPPTQSWNIEACDLLQVYEEALANLSEKTRTVFLMHRVDELSYRDIHERLGISVATVEYHMMKALAHIAVSVDAMR